MVIDKTIKTNYLLPVLLLTSLLGYGIIGYGIQRSNFSAFISIFIILSLCYYLILKGINSTRPLQWAIGAAVIFRLILLFALPNLSDDFYRFIWDGNLLAHGINPFAHTPQFYMQHGLPDFLSASLFGHLNSQPYYTVYPSVCQYLFAIPAALFGHNLYAKVAVMKAIMIIYEFSTFWVMKKLLNHFGLPIKYLLIYALNPFIILELTGNLHFEGVMIFFLLFSYYLFLKERWWLGAIAFTLAVNTKLIPLLLMPYLVFSLGWKRSLKIILVVFAGTLLLHLPFLDQSFLGHFGDSLRLYFQSFEYNASIYYLVRWVGFQIQGYNIIDVAAPVLSLISTAVILVLSWIYRRESLKNLPTVYIVLVSIYYLFSTTVHPWYVSSLVAFVPLAGLLFPLAWSALIPLTYITYVTPAYHENLWLVALEYIIVFGVMGYDLYHRSELTRKKIQRIFGSVPSFKE